MIAGATAVGGGDFTVVVDVESVVLLDVESVTIVSANVIEQAVTIAIATNIFSFLFYSLGCLRLQKTQETHYIQQMTILFS